MTHSKLARRRARAGRGLLPPNPAQWGNEHNGLDLREDLGLALDVALQHEAAFAQLEHVEVLPLGQVPVAWKYVCHFREEARSRWSGVGISLPGGHELVVYNDSHALNRIRATLMEEFFHIKLGHPRSVIRVLGDGDRWRTYDPEVEQEAYGSGAAALVPYYALREMVAARMKAHAIARHFVVSPGLVEYRMKVTKLYARARRRWGR